VGGDEHDTDVHKFPECFKIRVTVGGKVNRLVRAESGRNQGKEKPPSGHSAESPEQIRKEILAVLR